MGVLIEQGGMMTTVQDGGRKGYLQYGVPVAGAMDMYALALANMLVGNDRDAAALEATLIGPTLRFEKANTFAITGADFGAKLNGHALPHCRAIAAKAGDVLAMPGAKYGCRGYIAFAGGLDIPNVMGSAATYLRGGFGGHLGRKLQQDDRIGFTSPDTALEHMDWRYVTPKSHSGGAAALRAVRGPQDFAFTPGGIKTFFSSVYTATTESDRMGIRFDGPPVEHIGDGNMISDGIAPGSVQIPTNGRPIIMLADRQTTGGYTKVATVITADLGIMAQLKPGDKVTFCEVSVYEAQRLLREQAARLSEYERQFSLGRDGVKKAYAVQIDGRTYHVDVERIP